MRELHSAERPSADPLWQRLTAGGPSGNELLTALTAALLLVLLAVEGVTILQLRPLISVHMFVGMLLIPPVLLKMASTGYRFTRYYTGNVPYRHKGPPPLLMRSTAPVVVVSTVVVFVTGVLLLIGGPAWRPTIFPLHKLSFIVWGAFTGLHVLGHLPAIAPAVRTESVAHADAVSGRGGRMLALAVALVAGIVIAVFVIPDYHAWGPAVAHHFGHHHST